MYYLVTVKALGGPASDFAQREYEVEADSEGQAVDRAIPVAMQELNDRLGRNDAYSFVSAYVLQARKRIRFIGRV